MKRDRICPTCRHSEQTCAATHERKAKELALLILRASRMKGWNCNPEVTP